MAVPCLADDGITTVQENGRTVYINAETAQEKSEIRASRSRLMYWSSKEHEWKLVPAPSAAALSAARSAAAEVSSYVSAMPKSAGRSKMVNPNYRVLASGHEVTSEEIDQAIEEAAKRNTVDPNLVRAIIKVESNFNAHAVSRKGAMGLMQLMPTTARTLSVSNPFDPQQNVEAGVRHLKHLLDNYHGDVRLSLAAYNAGEGAVAKSNGIPPYGETRDYVKKITSLYMGDGPGTKTLVTSSAPIRVSREPNGVLRITNTE